MFSVALLAQAQPQKMPSIQWPISPYVTAGAFVGFAVSCLLLALLGWNLKWPWLLTVAEFLLPDGDEEHLRRRRRPRYRD